MDPSEAQFENEILQDLEQCRTLFQQENLDRALEILERDLELARKRFPPNHTLYGSLVVNLADCHLQLRNYAIAERLVSQHLEQLDENGNEELRDHCRNLLANIYMQTFRSREAEALLLESIGERSKKVGDLDPSQISETFLLLLSYFGTERIQEATDLLPRLKQMRQNIPPGYQDAQRLADIVGDAFDLLGVPVDPAQATTDPASAPEERLDDKGFYQAEAGCWRQFINREFEEAARSGLRLLVERTTLRLLEIRLISLLWMSESVERDAKKALAVLAPGSWVHALVQFTLGKVSFDDVLKLSRNADEVSQSCFYAGMLALQSSKEERARDYFQKAIDAKGDVPEHSQARHELEALGILARDISEFDLQEQAELKRVYRNFALLNYSSILEFTSGLHLKAPTPQLLLMWVASLRALGQTELSDDLAPHLRRQLLRWPWHVQMLELLTGSVPAQAFLAAAQSPIQLCQLHYYGMVRKRFTGQWEEAVEHRNAALNTQAQCSELELAELDGSEPAVLIDNANRQMVLLVGSGQLTLAEQIGRAAVAAARKITGLDLEILVNALSNLAAIEGQQGKLVESMRLFDELETLVPRLPIKDQFLYALNRGQLYVENNLPIEARRFLLKAWEISQTLAVEPHEAAALGNAMGQLASQSGDWEESRRWHQQAGSALKNASPDNPLLRAIISDNIGVALAIQGKYSEALAYHKEAYDILSAETVSRGRYVSDSHPSLCKIVTNLSSALTYLGDFAEAETWANEALRICDGTAGMEAQKYSALIQLAQIFAAKGRPADALERLLQGAMLSDRELGEMMAFSSDELRMGYVASVRFELSMLVTLAGHHLSNDSQRLELVFDVVLRRKGLLGEAAAVRRDSVLGGRYPRLRPLLEELAALQSQIATFTLAAAAGHVSLGEEASMAATHDRARRLEATLAREIPELELDMALREVKSRRLLSAVPAGWNIVEFVRTRVCNFMLEGKLQEPFFSEERYWAFVIPSADLNLLTLLDLGPAAPLDEAVASLLSRLGDSPDVSDPSVEYLQKNLVEPVFSRFSPPAHILIVPEGSLVELPFEVLMDDQGQYVIDSYSFSYLATCRDLLRLSMSNRAKASPDIVVADPDFDDLLPQGANKATGKSRRFERLPGTRREGEAIAKMLGVQPWLGTEARETKIRQLASPRILHLATHGFFDQTQTQELPKFEGRLPVLRGSTVPRGITNPLLRSGLAFAGANNSQEINPGGKSDDGLLTAAEVTSMNLLGTELVVLSACETGRGSVHATEGVMGVRRSFQLAGARTVIASLWKLPDEQTCELMTGFYRRLIHGMARGSALRAAQLELRKKFPSPFYWGAFVCFGDISAIPGMEKVAGYGQQQAGSAEDVHKAIRELSLVIEAHPSNSEALLRRGICYHNLDRLADAIADFNRAAELAPDAAEIFYSRGFSLHRLKRYREAVQDFNRALELEPDYAEAFHRRGNLFAATGETDRALKDLTQATQLAPSNPDVFYDRAGFLAEQRSFPLALEDYSSAIRLRPNFQIAYVNRGTILLELGKVQDAAHDLEMAIQLAPDDALAYLNLGSAYALLGDTKKALGSWQEAARRGDGNVIQLAQRMQASLIKSVGKSLEESR